VALKKRDTLLSHCLVRAMLVEHGGDREAVIAAADRGERLGRWQATRLAMKVTPKASRVAGFIVLWAVALDELGDELGPETFVEWSFDSRATVYRRLADFRELFDEFDTPTPIARQLLEVAKRRGESVSPTLAIAV
jgi:hypothetical protein